MGSDSRFQFTGLCGLINSVIARHLGNVYLYVISDSNNLVCKSCLSLKNLCVKQTSKVWLKKVKSGKEYLNSQTELFCKTVIVHHSLKLGVSE